MQIEQISSKSSEYQYEFTRRFIFDNRPKERHDVLIQPETSIRSDTSWKYFKGLPPNETVLRLLAFICLRIKPKKQKELEN